MSDTALIDEVREIRRQISEKCGNDPDKITRYAERVARKLGYKVGK